MLVETGLRDILVVTGLSSSPHYQPSQILHLVASFAIDGADTDPTEVLFQLKDDAGTVTVLDPVHDSIGKYHADFLLPNVPGMWTWRIEGTGAATDAKYGYFRVLASGFQVPGRAY